MDTVSIVRVPKDVKVPLTAATLSDVWERTEAVSIDAYPWWSEPADLRATARLLYNDSSLYIYFRVADEHVRPAARELNSDVWRDSCVELSSALSGSRAGTARTSNSTASASSS